MSYDKLLDVFFFQSQSNHAQSTGSGCGDQYRSVIFYHSPEQKAAAEAAKAKLDQSGRFLAAGRYPGLNRRRILARGRISSALFAEARANALRDLMEADRALRRSMLSKAAKPLTFIASPDGAADPPCKVRCFRARSGQSLSSRSV